MKCPECRFENREEAKFCNECGHKFELNCPECGTTNRPGAKFCDACGYNFIPAKETSDTIIETEGLSFPSPAEKPSKDVAPIIGERKYVTVLFSDLTGYTEMSERLDPEEVKDITTHIFDLISKIISKYDGFIEKFAGDAVMALFGAATSHEDDPVRAIHAAREIHHLVNSLSPQYEERIEQSLSMHSGINTGLVVTGEINLEKGIHGVAGDTINLAARLSSLAKPGEIFVGQGTYHRTEGHFTFEVLEPSVIKGKADPVQIYKVIDQKERPITIHRLSGVRADLIGRRAEIAELQDAVKNLQGESGRIFSICGDAGTGKSRLVEEFKSSLDLKKIQWLEGRAYPYAQNIPYFPLMDLLNRVFQIEEGDSQDIIRQKIESGVANLVDKKEIVIPYVGSLYSLHYPEIGGVSPEFWKSRLRDVGKTLISALARRAPTVFLLEDLHWADPSFVEFLRYTLLEVQQPAIVLCVYRPIFSLFTTHQERSITKIYQEIRIKDLSASEAQDMLESLLKAENIPSELRLFVKKKAEGNPFYLEELINSLIETETLSRDNGSWKLLKPIAESDISSTIHDMISGRLDRLEKETKRILQEASVIGRAFLYDILKRISELKTQFDTCLSSLERLDFIRTRSLQPDLEYIFKHALTQEVVYNGLLKKERQAIHERIGVVIEQLFCDRLTEFYETLSFHFIRGQSIHKAVDYLMKSSEKSLKIYAVEESNQYFKEAYDILTTKGDQSSIDGKVLIRLLNKWALTLYYLGSFRIIEQLFEKHKKDAEALDNQSLLGMYYIWLGMALFCREKSQEADRYLSDSLRIGREINDEQVIAYALTWLCWSRVDLGKFDDVTVFAEEARERSKLNLADDYPYYKSTGGEGLSCFMAGNSRKNKELGEMLLTLGTQKSQIRSLTLGHVSLGYSHDSAGDFPLAIKNYRRAITVAKDPMYEQYSRVFLALSLLQNGQVNESKEAFEEVTEFCDKQGFDAVGSHAKFYLGFIQILNGQMSKGMKNIETILQKWVEIDRKPALGMAYLSLGKLYAQIASGTESVSLKTMLKNVGFIIKNVPSAMKKAEEYLFQAIEYTGNINATGLKAQSLLELGLLYKRKGNKEKAIKPLKDAIKIFKEYGNHVYLEQARSALESL